MSRLADPVVISHYGDIHADAVLWGLRLLGHNPLFIDAFRFFDDNSIALYPDKDQTRVVLNGSTIDRSAPIWFRRPHTDQMFTKEKVHPADRSYCKRAAATMMSAFYRSLDAHTHVISHLDALAAAECKALQQVVAERVGLTIPETVMTNDVSLAKDFASSRAVISKSFRQHKWLRRDGTVLLPKVRLCSSEDFNVGEDSLKRGPMIFQTCINSMDEIRVVVFGRTLFAVSLGYRNESGRKLDWRRHYDELNLRRIELPDDVVQMIFSMMDRLGLSFGAMDFVRDEEDRLHFLEVNSCGQWLWMNDERGSLPILDAFVKFLVSGNSEYRYDERKEQIDIEYGDYLAERGNRLVEDQGGDENPHGLSIGEISKLWFSRAVSQE